MSVCNHTLLCRKQPHRLSETSLRLHSYCGTTVPCTDSCCSQIVASSSGFAVLPACFMVRPPDGQPSCIWCKKPSMASMTLMHCFCQDSTTLHSCTASRACFHPICLFSAAYMSSPCHIELILSEKDSTVPAEVGTPLPACFHLSAVCAPLQCTGLFSTVVLTPPSPAAVKIDGSMVPGTLCSSLPAACWPTEHVLARQSSRHADQRPMVCLQKEATKGTKLTRQQRAKQLRSGVKAITS